MKQSKKVDDIGLDDFDLDDFDFGDDLIDGSDPSKDRSPITDFGVGAIKGVKTTASDPSLYINTMRSVLPDGYGNAYDAVTDVKDKGLGLYNEVLQDLRPGIRDLKSIGRRAKGAVNSLLPDKLSGKLDEWLRDKDVSRDGERTLSKEQLREQSISSELGELFKLQSEDKQEERTEGLMRDVVDTKRFSTTTQQIDGIRKGISQLVSYQDSITSKYQRKSLELQYRSYYIQRDLLEITKASVTDYSTLFKNIQKNTALPESEKIKLSEIASQLTKERLIGVAQDKLSPSFRDFTEKFAKNLGGRVKEKVGEFKDAVATFSMAADSTEGLEEMGGSASGMAGELGGESLMRTLAEKIGKRIRPHLANNDAVVSGGNQANYLAENGHNVLRDYLETNPSANSFIQMFQEIALDSLHVRRETKVGYDDITKATTATPWDNLARKSLVEVIPGWLARIHQGIQLLAGNEQGLMTYDHSSNEYKSVSKLATELNERALSKDMLEDTRNSTRELTKDLLGDSDDEELKSKVEMMFLSLAREKGYLNPEDLLKNNRLSKYGFSPEELNTVEEATRSKFAINDLGKGDWKNNDATALKLKMSRSVETIRDRMPKPYELVNQFANTGNYEAVRASGLTNKIGNEDHVDETAFYRKFLDKVTGVSNETTATEDTSSRVRTNSPNFNRVTSAGYTEDDRSTFQDMGDGIETMVHLIRGYVERNQSAQTGIGGYETLEQTMRDTSSREAVHSAGATLIEILELLKSGISFNGTGEGGISGNTTDNETNDGSVWGSIRSLGRHAKSYSKRGWKQAKRLATPFSMINRATSSIFGKAKDLTGKGIDIVAGLRPRNLHLPGEAEPILTKVKMKAGAYTDKLTGKVIRSLKDITGPVLDEDGEEILTTEQFKQGLTDVTGKAIELGKGYVGKAMDRGAKVASWAKNKLTSAFGLPGMIAGKVLEYGTRAINYIPDVYLPGEPTPRLLRTVMKAGGYFNHVDGTPIGHLRDIKSDVADSSGNIVLEMKDLPRIVDRSGKPIKSMLGKLKDLAGKAFGKVKAVAGWAKNKLLAGPKLIGKGLKYGKNLIKRTGKAIGGIGTNNETIDKIYDILVRYFASKGLKMPEVEMPPRPKAGYTPAASNYASDKAAKVKAGFAKVTSDLGEAGNGLKSKGSVLLGTLKAKGSDIKNVAKDRIQELKSDPKSTLKSVKSKASGKISNGVKTMMAKMLGISAQDAEDRLESMSGAKRSISERARDKVGALKERTGSWRNILDKRKQKVKPGTGPLKPKRKSSGGIMGMMSTIIGVLGSGISILSGILGFSKGILGGIGKVAGWVRKVAIGKGIADAAGGLPDMDGPDRKKSKGPGGKKGWLSKAWKGAKTVGKAALAVGSFAGKIARGVGWVARGAAVVASGVISAPVALAAAAIAAVAVGGYYTYKYFSNKLTMMQRLRMSQYGVSLDSNKDACVMVAELESKLSGNVTIGDDGTGAIIGSPKWAELIQIFGIEASDEPRLNKFRDWFERRFKPVFMNHMALLKRLGNSSDLQDADKVVKDASKWPYAKSSKFEPSRAGVIYTVTSSPFADQELISGTTVIDEVIEEFREEYEAISKRPETKKQSKVKSTPRDAESETVPDDAKSAIVKRLEAKDPDSLTDMDRKILAAYRKRDKMKANEDTNNDTKPVSDIPAVDDAEDRKYKDTGRTMSPTEARIRSIPKEDLTPTERKQLRTYKRMEKMRERARENGTYTKSPETTSYTTNTDSTPQVRQDAKQAIRKQQDRPYEKIPGNIDVLGTLPDARADGTRDGVNDLLLAASNDVGVDANLLSKLAMQASGYDASLRNGSRVGMFQMDRPTWQSMLNNFGDKYGLGRDHSQRDIKAEALMAAEYLKLNLGRLEGLEINDRLIKLAHYLGAEKARNITGLPDEAQMLDVLPSSELRRLGLDDTATKANVMAAISNDVKDRGATKFSGNFKAPAKPRAITNASVVRPDASEHTAQTVQNQARAKRQVVEETTRQKVRQVNVDRQADGTMGSAVNDILIETLTVQSDSKNLLGLIEVHMRNLSKQLLESDPTAVVTTKLDKVPEAPTPPPTPVEAPKAPPKSRVNSKRS